MFWEEEVGGDHCVYTINSWTTYEKCKGNGLTLVLIALFLATGRDGRFSLRAAGKPVEDLNSGMLYVGVLGGGGKGASQEWKVFFSLIGAGALSLGGTHALLTFTGDACVLFESPPMLSFLTTLVTSDLFSVFVSVVIRRTGRLTMGMMSGMFGVRRWTEDAVCDFCLMRCYRGGRGGVVWGRVGVAGEISATFTYSAIGAAEHMG